MTYSPQNPEFQTRVLDYVLAPHDLVEIMEDLKGEELSLEEVALTLLAGGIELEYLETKYKTDKGDKSLIVLIACQDNLKVDWFDLHRRHEEVLLAVVGDYLRLDETTREQVRGSQGNTLLELVKVGEELELGDTPLLEWQFACFKANVAQARRVIESTGRVRLLSGGIAPKWTAPHVGPAFRQGPPPEGDPDLGLRGQTAKDGPFRLQKTAEEALELGIAKAQGKGPPRPLVTMRVYSRLVHEEGSTKYESFLSEWSKHRLRTIVGEAIPTTPPLGSQDPERDRLDQVPDQGASNRPTLW